ncbi:MAG: tyrosine--tRNA ligase [Parcubacteria group bacterium]|jgi:tyrosyl-tRNA synthetase|nr:tyrosine--tRNA ligase [Parcubacteria group bacterium]|tara:strand:- start:6462 stop:7661 length:1200 start_codon:yes stop_codon:yes gene_type:complete
MGKEKQIKEVLTRGVENVYPDEASLEKVLRSDKKIRLYCGFDPSASSLHIGNAIQIRKLAQFQRLGHEVIFLIGDFTGMIGDPDKISVRQKLTRQQVLKNSENYKEQASKILDFSGKNPAKVMYNSQWNDKLRFIDLVELASHFTAQQIMARDMFKKRMQDGKDLYLHEFLYPLTQAYDSVAMDVDLEVGGNDQMFNMLAGRTLMKKMKNKEKYVMTIRLLEDPNGKKMGKTEGNIVSLNEKPSEMFGQIMAWPDGLIIPGLELCTDIPMEEIKQIEQDIKADKLNPRDAKARLAKEIISIHHNSQDAGQAEKEFEKVFKDKDKPSQIPICKLSNKKYNILDLLVEIKLASSKGEAKRLIGQGGVKIDDQKINDWQKEIIIKDGMIIQAGKRKFIRVKI